VIHHKSLMSPPSIVLGVKACLTARKVAHYTEKFGYTFRILRGVMVNPFIEIMR